MWLVAGRSENHVCLSHACAADFSIGFSIKRLFRRLHTACQAEKGTFSKIACSLAHNFVTVTKHSRNLLPGAPLLKNQGTFRYRPLTWGKPKRWSKRKPQAPPRRLGEQKRDLLILADFHYAHARTTCLHQRADNTEQPSQPHVDCLTWRAAACPRLPSRESRARAARARCGRWRSRSGRCPCPSCAAPGVGSGMGEGEGEGESEG